MIPKISVVLTCHPGYDKYLPRAIDSVINQTFKDWELVVSYDGPLTKEAVKILSGYEKDNQIRHIASKKNFGQHPRPKNDGTKAATGEYINYLDADNAFRKDHLQALYREALKTGADVTYGDRMIINEQDPKKKVAGVSSDFNLGLLGQQNYIDTSDALVKRQAILDIGGWDEELQYFADWNLWVRLAKAGYTFRHLALYITDYYWHGENNVLKSHEAAKSGKALNFDVQSCKLWPDKTSIGKRPNPKVAIFMLTYDRLNLTIETITSMYEKTKYPFDLYIVDNGSTDKTQIWLADNEKKYGFKYYLEGKNVGISKGSNDALDLITGNPTVTWKGFGKEVTTDMGNTPPKYDIIGKVDNDCDFLTEDWLETIVDIWQTNRKAIVSPYVEGLIDHPGGSQRIHNGYIGQHYVGIVEHLGGICCFAPAEAYKGFRWKEKDFLHGMQDAIFSIEMKKKGYMLMYLETVRIEHLFNTSFSEKGYELEKPEEKEYRERRKKEKVTKYEG